ncbi:MAG: DNA-binding response regulator [Bacteroidota bacterium]|nr:DNA-binding response regulator [Bacteroidota bacterium]
MNQISAVLVDDEPDTLQTLQLLLKKHCPEIKVLDAFTDAKTALRELPKLNPELLILDIQMPGITGFEILEKYDSFKGSVIFVTAHSSHAIRAIKFSALDYLLKPIDISELKQAIEKFKKLHSGRPDNDVLRQLAKNIEFLSNPVATKIAVSTQEGIEIVLLSEVDYLKADRNYTLIKRTGKKDMLVSKPLKDFEETLSATQFMRIHSGYLVNLNKVQRYVRADGGYAVMEDGTQITVSRSHKDEFIRYLKA